jgi:hypothetical protein
MKLNRDDCKCVVVIEAEQGKKWRESWGFRLGKLLFHALVL